MSLREQLRADMAASMRSGETLRRDTLRMALSALSLVEKEQKHDATDEETLTVLVKAVKTRRESVDAYAAANRPDLAAAEEAAMQALRARDWVPDYLTVRRQHDLSPITGPCTDPLVVLGAAKLGKTRLIDNFEV